MKDFSQISVILPTLNNEKTILDAVNSILGQSYPFFELIVVNDGSSDGTKRILDSIDDPRFKLIENSKNLGIPLSRNKAIAMSVGRYIACHDADDISMPDRFEKQFNYMESHPDIAILGSGRKTIDEHGKVINLRQLPETPSFTDLLKSNCFVHGSVMIRRNVLDDVGFYNEDFRYTLDYELWLRIAQTGSYKMHNLQECLYGQRVHLNRVTLTQLPKQGLYRLLAKNKSLEKVPPEVMSMIREQGIDAYYSFLSIEEKVLFHKRVKQKYVKNGLYKEAIKHLLTLIQLKPYYIHLIAELVFLRIMKLLCT